MEKNNSHKYVYKLVDGTFDTVDEMYRGVLVSKKEADSWVQVGSNRATHEFLWCTFTGKRCSEDCWNV